MTFKNAIKKLGIEKYEERILQSNSHGELFYLNDYIMFAKVFSSDASISRFKNWFDITVKLAEDNWERPESIFQHIPELLENSLP